MVEKTQQVYGIHPVKTAINSLDEKQASTYQQSKLYLDRLNNSQKFQQLKLLAKKKKLDIQFCQKAELDKLCPHNHQGLLFVYQSSVTSLLKIKSETFLEQYIEQATDNLFFLILDEVQDPHNLGACLRTANATGVDAIIIPKDRSVSITPVVSKVACGAEQFTPIIQVTNLARTIDYLKSCQLWVIGAAGEAKDSLYDMDFNGNIAIAMGAEGKGLRRLTREKCDHLMYIPMLGEIESLNVSVATGVILYTALQHRSR